MRPYIIFFLCLLLASCGHDRLAGTFQQADSLVQTAPDSAIILLDGIEPLVEKESKDVKMYYRLLRVKASDKADCMKPDEQAMLSMVDYFSEHSREHLTEALYYMGRTYRMMQDAPQARDYFIKTIDVAIERRCPKSDNYYRGKAFSQLGSIYIYQDMYRESAVMYRRSFEVCHSSADTLGMVYNLRDLSNAYYCMGRSRQSMAYARRALTLMDKSDDAFGIMRKELTSMLAANAFVSGQYSQAKQYLDRLLPTDDAQILIEAYTTAAPLYLALGQESKSMEASRYLLAHGNLYDKQKAARVMLEWAMRHHDSDKAYRLTTRLIGLNDSLNSQRKTETLMRMNALYNYNTRVKENMKLRAQKSVYRFWMLFAVATCSFLAAAFVFFVRYSRQKQQLLRMKLAHYQDLMNEKKKKEATALQHEKSQIGDSDIYRDIRRRLNTPSDNKRLNDDEWQQLAHTIDRIYPLFHQRLFDLCKVNEQEYHVSMLIKVGFPPTAIAALTTHSRESVTATRRRLYEKAFGRKGTPKDWDDIILSL